MGEPLLVLVEDDPSDVMLIELAMKKSRVPAEVHVLADGDTAVRFIESSGGQQRGTLYMVDLNLPRRSGFEVLEAIRKLRAADEAICSIAMSSSTTFSEQSRALALGASQFISKPSSVAELDQLAPRLASALEQLGGAPLRPQY